MSLSQVLYQVDDGLARISLNRPDKINALGKKMVADLAEAFAMAAADPEVRVVVLSAQGKHFCAGHLMDEMVDAGAADAEAIFRNCSNMMLGIQKLPQPVIAQVHGVATAAGCQLVAACDLAVAARGTRFGTPGVKIGLFCGTPAVPLVRAVGRKRAFEMLLTGRWVDAEEALDWGLVNMVVPGEDLAAETEGLARRIAQASPFTLAMGKRTFYDQVDRAETEAYNTAVPAMAVNLESHDAQEGMKAFLEKRDPVWKGR